MSDATEQAIYQCSTAELELAILYHWSVHDQERQMNRVKVSGYSRNWPKNRRPTRLKVVARGLQIGPC